jgi:peptide deformylase
MRYKAFDERSMKLKIQDPRSPILRKPCLPLTLSELHSRKMQNIIEEMLEITYGRNNKGPERNTGKAMTVGLSANQVGIGKRISIVDLAIGRKSFSDIHVLVNPEILWKSKSLTERHEGCVNLPNIWGYVKRSQRVKVSALDRSGNKIQLDVHGWPAVLLQHEIGHLNGELFIDKLPDPTKAHLVSSKEYQAHKKAGKKWQKFIDVSSLVKKQV